MRRPVPSSAVPLALIAAVLVASGCSSESKPPTPLHVSTFELQSKLLGKQLDQVLVTPQGGGHGRPLLVFLHGYGGGPGARSTTGSWRRFAGSAIARPWSCCRMDRWAGGTTATRVAGGPMSYRR